MSDVTITLSGGLSQVILANARIPTTEEAEKAWRDWTSYLTREKPEGMANELHWSARLGEHNKGKFVRDWIATETKARLERIAQALAADTP